MHYRAISYVNLPTTYDEAILAQFVVHHATDSDRTIRVECLRCHHTCQIFKCRFAVGQLSVNCWPTVYRQTFRRAVLHFYRVYYHSGSRQQLAKVNIDHINVGTSDIRPVGSVQNLGLWFDCSMTMS